jgi:hypothetical protein
VAVADVSGDAVYQVIIIAACGFAIRAKPQAAVVIGFCLSSPMSFPFVFPADGRTPSAVHFLVDTARLLLAESQAAKQTASAAMVSSRDAVIGVREEDKRNVYC